MTLSYYLFDKQVNDCSLYRSFELLTDQSLQSLIQRLTTQVTGKIIVEEVGADCQVVEAAD